MKSLQLMAALAILTAMTLPVVAEIPEPTTSAKPLGFLEIGRDYSVCFPKSHDVFTDTLSGIISSPLLTGKIYQSSWIMYLTNPVFTVRKKGDNAWVLLEHPASRKDAVKWNIHKLAIALLTPERIKEFEATKEGQKKLASLKKSAAQKIETTTTWVNLDHAIAISDISTKPKEFDLDVKASLSLNAARE